MRRCLWAIRPLAPFRRERHNPYFPRNKIWRMESLIWNTTGKTLGDVSQVTTPQQIRCYFLLIIILDVFNAIFIIFPSKLFVDVVLPPFYSTTVDA